MASLGEIRYVIRMRTNKYTAYNSPLLDSFLLMTFPVMPSPQLLKRLSDRYRFCWLIQHFGNIFSALCQHPVIKLLAIGSLQPLGRFQLLISPNSLTGDIQFPGIHIRRLLLQLGVLCQCRIQFRIMCKNKIVIMPGREEWCSIQGLDCDQKQTIRRGN